jgi:hypothetical protein
MVTWNLQGPAPEQGRREQPGQSFPERIGASPQASGWLHVSGSRVVTGSGGGGRLAESFAFANCDRNDEVAVLVKRHAGGQTTR